MNCPRCKLINPDTAERCDCGYDFVAKRVLGSYLYKEQTGRLADVPGLDGLAAAQLKFALERGCRIVIYEYCISLILVTYKRPSRVVFVSPEQGRIRAGLRYSAVSLLFGWWGIPWGPIYTVLTIIQNFQGGNDITDAVVRSMSGDAA